MGLQNVHWIMKTYFFTYIILVHYAIQSFALQDIEKCALTGIKELLEHIDCSDNGTYLDQEIYLEKGYHKTEPPDRANTTVKFSFDFVFIKEVDDKKQQMTFDMKVSESWVDPRIKANFSESESYKDIKMSEARDLIWKPEIRLRKITNLKSSLDSIDVQVFRIMKKEELGQSVILVERIVRGMLSVYCSKWNLDSYPLDEQICELEFFQLAPYNLSFDVSPHFGGGNEDRVKSFQVSHLLISDQKEFGIIFKLKRKLQPYFISCYLPSIAIVCLSGSSFLLPSNPLPGRVGLGVTNFLTLTNLLIHETVNIFYIQYKYNKQLKFLY